MSLSDVTIIVPTFHRRGYLQDCLEGVSERLPECCVAVASDDGLGIHYGGARGTWKELPYDSGLTAKRNAAVKMVRTKYALMGSDDFDFSTWEPREAIIDMAMVLDGCPNVDVVVGQVNGRDYQGFLEYVPGEYIKERRLDMYKRAPLAISPFPIWKIDIGVNFFLARTEVLREVPWDETIRPIGGEHADWFLDLKAAGKIVAFLPLANVNEMPHDLSKQHPDYLRFRRRCWEGHALMMKKRNIKAYYGFDEEVNHAAHRR